jgi:hypothetical protein
MSDNSKDMSKHILPTASNLLGICFIILNFIKIWKVGRVEAIIIDKLVGLAMGLFLTACILSYASMRSRKRPEVYEKGADLIFLIGLIFLTVIAVISAFEIL